MYTGQQYGNNPNQVAYAAPKSSPSAPYPTPGFNPKQRSPGGDKLGITLKVVSLFLGMIAMSLALHGYFNAKWFHKTYPYVPETCRRDINCEPGTRNPDEQCEEEINKPIKNHENKEVSKLQLACPSRWLVIPEAFIIAFVWVGTLVGFFLLLVADSSKTKSVALKDMVGHMVAGFLTIVSALCLLGFSLDVIVTDNCDKLWKLEKLGHSVHLKLRKTGFRGPNSPTTPAPGGGYPGKEELLKMLEEGFKASCNEELTEYFFQWHIFSAGLFALLTGILYIVIGVFVLIGSRGGQNQMMGQGVMAPSQQPAILQQTPSMPDAQSPSQAPAN